MNTNNCYVDFDLDLELWGIFNLDTGFCYGLYFSEGEAKEKL